MIVCFGHTQKEKGEKVESLSDLKWKADLSIQISLWILLYLSTMLRCPICRKETIWDGNPFRPFCSKRCQIVDLAAWASDSYRVPEDSSSDDFISHEDLT